MQILAAEWRMNPNFLADGRMNTVIKRLKWGRIVRLDRKVYVLFFKNRITDAIRWIRQYHHLYRVPFWMDDIWIFKMVSRRLDESNLSLAGLKREQGGWVIAK